MSLRYVSYSEPAWGYKESLAVEHIFREDEAVRLWKETHPWAGREVDYERVLEDFMAVNWAVFV